MSSPYDSWNLRWQRLQRACTAHGMCGRWAEGRGLPPDFSVAPLATQCDVEQAESALAQPLPAAFRKVVLEYSASVTVLWQAPEGIEMPEEFGAIFAGECRWDLTALPALFEEYRDWIKNCFSNPDDDYDRVWHSKFPILQVGNGDIVAIDPAVSNQPVVYLSHDGGEGHGYCLGNDFIDYVDRLSRLGCPGAEDWQWLMFVDGPSSGLLVDSPIATRWRKWFGID